MTNIKERFASRNERNLKPYIPGEQPKDREYIKLNANENPYDIPVAMASELGKFVTENRKAFRCYPDPDARELSECLAEMLNSTGGVLSRANVSSRTSFGKTREVISPGAEYALPFKITSDMIYVGNGSDEVLSFIFYAFFSGNNQKVILTDPSYSFYPVYASYYQIQVVSVPVKLDWTIDVDALITAMSGNNAPLVLANPNAPTGISLARIEIERILESAGEDRLVVIDEAYVDFGGESVLPLVKKHPNLIIVRTFSKSLSAAGVRLGYAVGQRELIEIIRTVKNSVNHFPVDAFAERFGVLLTKYLAHFIKNTKKVVETREDFARFLKERNWEVLPSNTNFLFIRKVFDSEKDEKHFRAKGHTLGERVYEILKKRGILVRYFSGERLGSFVRVTIGSVAEMERLKEEIARLDSKS